MVDLFAVDLGEQTCHRILIAIFLVGLPCTSAFDGSGDASGGEKISRAFDWPSHGTKVFVKPNGRSQRGLLKVC